MPTRAPSRFADQPAHLPATRLPAVLTEAIARHQSRQSQSQSLSLAQAIPVKMGGIGNGIQSPSPSLCSVGDGGGSSMMSTISI